MGLDEQSTKRRRVDSAGEHLEVHREMQFDVNGAQLAAESATPTAGVSWISG